MSEINGKKEFKNHDNFKDGSRSFAEMRKKSTFSKLEKLVATVDRTNHYQKSSCLCTNLFANRTKPYYSGAVTTKLINPATESM